jgi:ribose transport system substrate-binding protein
MRNSRWIATVFAVVAAAALLGSCAAKPKQKTVAVVTPYMANETTKYVIDVFKGLGEAKGWKVNVTDTAGDFGLLVGRIQDAVTQKVDAIVLGMGDPVQMTAGLAAAQKAGIPVFGLDAGLADGVLLNITSDNASLGQISARALADAIGNKGKVYMFTHDPHPGVRERAAAAAAYFATQAGIEVVAKKHIEVPGPLDFARKLSQDILTASPAKGSIAGIWAGWDEPAMGAVQAIEAAGRTGIKVVGIDGTPFAKAEIAKKGPFLASVAQDFDGMAARLVGLVEATLAGTKPVEQLIKIPGKLISQ